MTRRIRAFLVALMVTAGILVVVQSPAAAAPSNCGAVEWCAWKNPSWPGNPDYRWNLNSFVGQGCFQITGGMNEAISSATLTYTLMRVELYYDAYCGHFPLVTELSSSAMSRSTPPEVVPWVWYCNDCISSFKVKWA